MIASCFRGPDSFGFSSSVWEKDVDTNTRHNPRIKILFKKRWPTYLSYRFHYTMTTIFCYFGNFKRWIKMKWILFGKILLFAQLSSAVPVESTKIMVSAAHQQAVDAGLWISKQGGNVVDVAVATALALSVTNPHNASLGGGGFALVKLGSNDVEALDFREVAPKNMGPDYYLHLPDRSSINGGTAVGVPGMPAGWFELHKKYGKVRWPILFKPAIKLAEEGFPVSGYFSRVISSQENRFNKTGHETFFKDKKAILPGGQVRQKKLLKALRLYRDKKLKGFYEGEVAKDIATTVQKEGGVL
jgi:gamma-glutamyltranspeptidase / glutathione hydrolase